MARPARRADPPPLRTNDVAVITTGTIGWLVALLVMLPFAGRLNADGRGWWMWTCVAGIALGLYAIRYCRRRGAARERDHPPID